MSTVSITRASRGPLTSLAMTVATALLVTGCSTGQATTLAADDADAGLAAEVSPTTNGGAPAPDSGGHVPEAGATEPPEVATEQAAAQDPSAAEPVAADVDTPGTDDVDTSVGAADTPDYANDAGKDIQVYEYPDDPAPAESIVATLCNLNRDYIASLRPTADGVPVVDDSLPTTMLALSDYLSHWDTLRPHYPDAVADIDTAQRIHDLWDQALLERDNGDPDAAQISMLEAEKLLDQLPRGEANACLE